MADQGQQIPLTSKQLPQIEGIFHPLARSQRREVAGENSSARFVHYTSAEAALKIIATKRLWMRSTTAMEDYRGVQHGFGILQKIFSANPTMRTAFIQALDR
jgi:hypothetical protein